MAHFDTGRGGPSDRGGDWSACCSYSRCKYLCIPQLMLGHHCHHLPRNLLPYLPTNPNHGAPVPDTPLLPTPRFHSGSSPVPQLHPPASKSALSYHPCQLRLARQHPARYRFVGRDRQSLGSRGRLCHASLPRAWRTRISSAVQLPPRRRKADGAVDGIDGWAGQGV